jgi:hypothetical protein
VLVGQVEHVELDLGLGEPRRDVWEAPAGVEVQRGEAPEDSVFIQSAQNELRLLASAFTLTIVRNAPIS